MHNRRDMHNKEALVTWMTTGYWCNEVGHLYKYCLLTNYCQWRTLLTTAFMDYHM